MNVLEKKKILEREGARHTRPKEGDWLGKIVRSIIIL